METQEKTVITVETTINAPVEKVWELWSKPEHIIKWCSASDDWHTTSASVDLRPGGAFCSRMEAKDGSFGFDFAGTYTTVEEPRLIEYEFGGREASVSFTEVAGGTRVVVTFDSEDTHSIEQQRDGWQAILDSFGRYVEGKP